MRILALESADGACSVAWTDGETVDCRRNAEVRDSLSWLMQEQQSLRQAHDPAAADLDGIACCIGPGGFTGVRVSVGYAQGLGLACHLPVLGVSSLDALAQASRDHRPEAARESWVALDARMGELYAACYTPGDDGGLDRVGEERLIQPAALRDEIGAHAALFGPGFMAYEELFAAWTVTPLTLDAGAVARQALRVPLERWPQAVDLAPRYLRNQVARTLVERGVQR